MNDFPSLQRIFDTFDYDCSEGKLYRKSDSYRDREAGFVQRDGKRRVVVDLEGYLAADLIWIIRTGAPPVGDIEFLDGNLDNGRMGNLSDDGHSPTRR